MNVDFEWFNFKPDIDFHGVKSLLRQLFDVDSQLLNISALADLVLSQPTIGSTVKVDGEDTDAYAFLTVLSFGEHKDIEGFDGLRRYLLDKAGSKGLEGVSAVLKDETKKVGLVLAERLINVPAEIAPPMYGMLIDEVEAAVEDGEPYEFSHYVIVSKTYREIASALDVEEAPRMKKSKAGKGTGGEVFYFHPEDDILQKHAVAYGAFEYTRDEGEGMADSKRAFQEMGIKGQGLMILIGREQWEGAVKAMAGYLSPPT